MKLFAERLLEGSTIALGGSIAPAAEAVLRNLGARVELFEDGLGDERIEAWARALDPLTALVYDSSAAFGRGEIEGLRAATDQSWAIVRGVATGALIPVAGPGKIVLLAPRPDAGPHAQAARDALENLARTLSVEWARYSITITAIAPGVETTDDQLATLIAFLVSPGGSYYSGCRLELGAVSHSR